MDSKESHLIIKGTLDKLGMFFLTYMHIPIKCILGAEEGRRYIEKTVNKHSKMVQSIRELSDGLMELEAKLKVKNVSFPPVLSSCLSGSSFIAMGTSDISYLVVKLIHFMRFSSLHCLRHI